MLASMTALANVTSMNGSLEISRNAALPGIALTSLTTINTDLIIADNTAMTSLAGLDGLTSVAGTLRVSGNDQIPPAEVAAFEARLGRPVAASGPTACQTDGGTRARQ